MILANEALGVILSLLYVLVVVLSVEIYFRKKACTNKETFRKIIHILISNYIIIVCYFNTVYYFAMIPSSIFIFVNILSNKFRIIKSMERKTKNYCGTIWYALSVTMVVIFSFTIGCKYIALASVLVLGYGDGIAALIGSKFGKHYLPNSSKTLEGTCSMFCISLIIISSISYLATGDIDLKVILSGCIFATISEALITRGFDNLFIPLIISGVLWINQEIPNIETIIFMESLMVLIAFGAW